MLENSKIFIFSVFFKVLKKYHICCSNQLENDAMRVIVNENMHTCYFGNGSGPREIGIKLYISSLPQESLVVKRISLLDNST